MNEILQQRYTTDCIESTADVDEGPVTHIHFIYIYIYIYLVYTHSVILVIQAI